MSRPLAACLLLLVIVFAVYRPVLGNEFVNFDDQSEIIENPSYNPVTAAGLMWNFSHTRLSLYMPVTYLVWGAVAAVAPRTPAGVLMPGAFHALNLGLHGVATVLVFYLLRRCLQLGYPARDGTQNPGVRSTSHPACVAPFVGAMLFAVHPIQTEAVAWASGMYTILSTIWSLAAVLCYLKHAVRLRDHPQSFARGWYLLATGFFVLALLTKASAVIVPGVAGVIDLLLVGRPVKRVAMSLALWGIATVPIVYLAKSFQDLTNVPAPPAWARPLVAADAVSFYVRKIVWPIDFIPDYGRNPRWMMAQLAGEGPLNPGIDPAWAVRHRWAVIPSIALGGLVVLLLAALLAARRAPRATAGGLIFLAGVFPYLGLTTFDFQYVSTVADRYAYFGMVGVAMIAAAMIARVRRTLAIAFVCIPLAVITYGQTKVWHSTRTLFDYTLKVNNASLVARNVYGFLAAKQGRPAEAEWFYTHALMIWPEDAVIHFNLGNLYSSTNWYDADLALMHYRLAVQYQPRFSSFRYKYAAMLSKTGRDAEAIAQLRQALIDDPNNVDEHAALGAAYVKIGQPDSARVEFDKVLSLDPSNQIAQDGIAGLRRNAKPGPGAVP